MAMLGLWIVLLGNLASCSAGVIDPHGPVASAERQILLNSTAIMLCIVVPVILATLLVPWWYRASNPRARYRPDWTYSGKVEIVVWGVPAMVILLLGGIAWISSHELDPARPMASDKETLNVEVVSLDWKWLFIYPEQGLASVNRMVIPAGRPIALKLTSASVMNSFFVPQLASQIYTMSGMTTRLNLLADHAGQFKGLSAQFSGDGFSGMRFNVDAVGQAEFDDWVSTTRLQANPLDATRYQDLAQPSQNVEPRAFNDVDPGLFETIVHMTTLRVQQDASLAICRSVMPLSTERF